MRQRIIWRIWSWLQYDMMYGDQYVYGDSGMPVPEEHMVMGVKDAEISQMVVQADGTTYSITAKTSRSRAKSTSTEKSSRQRS